MLQHFFSWISVDFVDVCDNAAFSWFVYVLDKADKKRCIAKRKIAFVKTTKPRDARFVLWSTYCKEINFWVIRVPKYVNLWKKCINNILVRLFKQILRSKYWEELVCFRLLVTFDFYPLKILNLTLLLIPAYLLERQAKKNHCCGTYPMSKRWTYFGCINLLENRLNLFMVICCDCAKPNFCINLTSNTLWFIGKGTIMRENNQPKWPQTLKLNASKPLLAVKSNLLVYERDRKRAIRIIIPQNSTAIQTLEVQICIYLSPYPVSTVFSL